MVFDFFRRTGPSTVENVEAMLVEMMRDAKTVFDASTAAVFGGGKSKETRREVKSTDRGINRAQQEVRRALMVHATVHDPVDLPQVLTYMSVVKDVERVGDYAKNLYDLVKYGVDFEAADDSELLLSYCDAVGRLIDDAAEVEGLATAVEDNGDVYFVPAFSGLFAPHWRADARGALVGLTRFANKGHIARAALEATAFQTAEVVEANATLREIIDTLGNLGIGLLVVMDSGSVTGVISDRDVVWALAQGADPDEIWAADIMTRDLVTVEASTTIHDAAAAMRDQHVRLARHKRVARHHAPSNNYGSWRCTAAHTER